MAAMTMGFRVADPSMLATHRPGDRVRFSVVMRDDELVVTRLEVAR
jgi:Cu/Ag efflux protein CusF